jgi:metal-responsive CopG/Arc/MetJ family transcriptional regulator
MASTRVLITIDPELLGEIDETAKSLSKNRSEFIREAVRSYFTQLQFEKDMMEDAISTD